MTDVSAQPPTGSGGRNPKAAASMARDRQAAFWAIGLLLKLYLRYRRDLEEHIAPHPVRHNENQKMLKCHLARLAELDGLSVLAVVWSPRARKRKFGLGGKGNGAPIITRHALGKALQKTSEPESGESVSPKYLRRASRVVEAAITYGLLVEEQGQPGCIPGCKPLRGTKKLDDFMSESGDELAASVRQSFLYDGKQKCVPALVKKRKGEKR